VLVAASCQATAVLDDKRISFERRDNDLDWPLPNAFNAGEQIIHGRHCYKEIQDTFDAYDDMSLMHQDHCRGIIERIILWFKAHPNFHVDDLICQALTPVGEEISPIQVLRDTQLEPQVDVFDRIKYGRKKRMTMMNMNVDTTGTQNAVYMRFEGKNLGNVLLRNYTTPESLNPTERAYIGQWISDRAIVMGAVGVYCRVHGDLALVQKALDVHSRNSKN